MKDTSNLDQYFYDIIETFAERIAAIAREAVEQELEVDVTAESTWAREDFFAVCDEFVMSDAECTSRVQQLSERVEELLDEEGN